MHGMFGREMVVPVTNLLSEYEARPVWWLWPGRVPVGKVTLVCGDPGVGKSFLMMDMAARVTGGWEWPEDSLREEEGSRGNTGVLEQPPVARGSEGAAAQGGGQAEVGADFGQGEPGRGRPGSLELRRVRKQCSVLVMAGEDDPFDTMRPRIERAGGDTSRVVLLRAVQHVGHAGEWLPALDRHVGQIGSVLKKMDRPRLVIIDPVTAFLGRANSASNAAVRGVLDELSDMAASHGVAVVCVTHVNKAASLRAMYRVMGSLAFAASPRMVWRVEREGEGRGDSRSVMRALKNNLGGEAGAIGFRVVDGRVVWERVREPVEAEVPGALEEACRFLEMVLKDGPRGAVEVVGEAGRVGISVGTLRRAKGVLGVVARKEGAGWVWEGFAHAEP
jgi:putative DNA primase/helicase